ncbi:MAG: DinB family protein [Anaerolineae bacterium]|nr:DinB family protein [Anaerolineae bacterium]
MAIKMLSVEEILTLLDKNQRAIVELLAELTPTQLRMPANDGGWSAVEVLAHLRSCADVWGNCITTILAEDRPTIRAVNPTRWIKGTDYPELAFQPSFHAFTVQRTELLTLLRSLTAEDWLRGATVTGAGRPLERTVQFYAQWLGKHERSHLKQFKKLKRELMK